MKKYFLGSYMLLIFSLLALNMYFTNGKSLIVAVLVIGTSAIGGIMFKWIIN